MGLVHGANGSFARTASVVLACACMLMAVFAAAARATAPVGEVYVADLGLGEVSQFGFNTVGTLYPMPYPTIPSGGNPGAIAIAPNYKYVYVANAADNTISQYVVDPSGLLVGSLVPLSPSTVPSRCPAGIAVNHTSTTVYVTDNCDNALNEYRISSTGTLSSIGTVSTGARPYFVAAAPDAKAVYAGDFSGHAISQYTEATSGLLTPDSPATVAMAGGACPEGLAVSPNSKSVYATDACNGTVSHFAAATNGALTFKDLKGGAGLAPFDVAVTPKGTAVYATDDDNSQILEYAASTTGALTFEGVVATGSVPTGIAVAPSGATLYALSKTGDTVYEYKVATGGALTEAGGAELPSGASANALAVRK